MTTDQLRALINQCATLPDGRIEIDRSDMAEIARDAMRFRHISKGADHLRDTPRWGWSVEWGMWCDENMDLRAAIDADMGEFGG